MVEMIDPSGMQDPVSPMICEIEIMSQVLRAPFDVARHFRRVVGDLRAYSLRRQSRGSPKASMSCRET
jgi:hypothetical protein